MLHSLALQLNFVSTWGDPYYMGLTGLELLGANQEAIPLSFNMLKVRAEVDVLLYNSSRDVAVVRALASHQCGLRLIPAWCRTLVCWNLFLVFALI